MTYWPEPAPLAPPTSAPLCACGLPAAPGLESCAPCLARAVRVRAEQRADSMPRLDEKWGHPTQCDGCLRRRLCDIYTVRAVPLYLCNQCADIPDPVPNAPKAEVR